ncbi:MAG: type II toxin-antitoxin system VapC family toxin [Chloroflexi bacterium]|nr:type II toxin-antitoxin system VapC family toxin [Chloroflexota bacterium]
MVVIDTDVLLLAFAFHQDSRQADNSVFLQQVQADDPAITIYTLMELLGKLSFNLSPTRLEQWPQWLVDAYQLKVIWPVDPNTAITYHSWRQELFTRPFARMKAVKMPFMDALILNLAEQAPEASCFVTWNARHFQNKSTLPVKTPAGYLSPE